MAAAGEGHSGAINVTAGGSVDFAAGIGNQSFTMLGHGGFRSLGDHSGNITVLATDGVSFAATPSTGLGVNGDQAFAQLGHGGFDSGFETRSLLAEGGGAASGTNFHLNTPQGTAEGTSGDIVVRAGVDALGAVTNAAATIEFTTGADTDAYAQLGNGGKNTNGAHNGAITVAAGNAISFDASNALKVPAGGNPNANGAYVQLGHGGQGADAREAAANGYDGAITVSAGLGGAGGITFLAGKSE